MAGRIYFGKYADPPYREWVHRDIARSVTRRAWKRSWPVVFTAGMATAEVVRWLI